jgi:sugar-specific transcriptional regulator TrmB
MQSSIEKFVPFITSLGLKKQESQAYLALIQLGQARVGQISELCGIQRTFVYNILDKMAELGIVSSVEIRGVKRYSAISIDQLKRRQESRMSRFDEILPELRTIVKTIGDKPKVQFFEGKEGIIEAQNDTLDMPYGSEICAYYTGEGIYVDDPAFIKRYVKRRVAKKIHVRAIGVDTPNTRYWAEQDKAQLRNGRLVPADKFPFTNEINIYGNKINILSLQGELIAVVIESESVSKTQQAIFNLAWEGAEKYQK